MTYRFPYAEWTRASIEAWSLGIEASTVIGLRLMRMATGGPLADREAQLMWSEKMQAAMELQTAWMTGGLGTTPLSGTRGAVRHYRKKVRANRKRLG
ncbi:hypothetical protein M0208_16725 [Sphingomonas sp. SUN019]|uniref:hypothetical protein n=1 Tax=Sphingomonas sp. SUN019 TaxID=2937788 RepID=UPI0021648F1E|nr:hypothetical protein [Sphingomonas sp. SUN019]UVO52075.1 hypothetical protein M0208_16725 [Sphingomonas sp. SUN019]